MGPGPARPGAWRRLARSRFALAALAVIVLTALTALAAPWLPLADPVATDLAARLLPPLSAGHPLGTDQLGRDVLARLVHGARLSLGVAVVAVAVAAGLGTVIGLAAAYYGRLVDALLMRGIDVLMAFPYLLLALAIVAVLGPSLANAALAIAVVNVPFFARTVRGATLALKQADFVAAARLSGLSDARILASELLPNVAPVAIVALSTSLGWMILETAGLSFLGLGAQPPRADLGGMLGQSRHLMATAPHLSLIPGAAIFVVVVALNVLGDGLRDALDPKHVAGGGRAPERGLERPTRATPPAGSTPLLEVEGLTVAFPGQRGLERALEGISFRLEAGEAVGLVGESGSGKTVTALAVLGLLDAPARVLAGAVRFQGEALTGLPARERRRRARVIGYVPQDPLASLHPLMRIGEQVIEALAVRGAVTIGSAEARERAREALEQVRIPDPGARLDAYPHELSGGMRQRVAIAMALAGEPRLMIADEPTTALDVTTQAQILELLRELAEGTGAALLFISHDLGVISQLCDRVLVLRAGELVESAPSERLFASPEHPYTAELVRSLPRLASAGGEASS